MATEATIERMMETSRAGFCRSGALFKRVMAAPPPMMIKVRVVKKLPVGVNRRDCIKAGRKLRLGRKVNCMSECRESKVAIATIPRGMSLVRTDRLLKVESRSAMSESASKKVALPARASGRPSGLTTRLAMTAPTKAKRGRASLGRGKTIVPVLAIWRKKLTARARVRRRRRRVLGVT